jgi:hypothetical protein
MVTDSSTCSYARRKHCMRTNTSRNPLLSQDIVRRKYMKKMSAKQLVSSAQQGTCTSVIGGEPCQAQWDGCGTSAIFFGLVAALVRFLLPTIVLKEQRLATDEVERKSYQDYWYGAQQCFHSVTNATQGNYFEGNMYGYLFPCSEPMPETPQLLLWHKGIDLQL